jgi:phytoene dehydrogenase-like protein
MSKNEHDIVVVGAGHNTLTTAAYLAKAGLRVLVLEKNSIPGGGAVSQECTAPGFIHDMHATASSHLQIHPIIAQDELQLVSRFGLEFAYSEIPSLTIFPDGDTLCSYNEVEKTCQEIARYSEKDADSYRRLFQFMEGVMPVIGMTMTRPPASLGNIISLMEKAPFGNDLIQAMMKSAFDIVTENFEHPKVRMHLLKFAATTSCAPEEKTTGLNLLFLIAGMHNRRVACVVGGTQNLSLSMVRSIEAHGGEVRCNTLVKRIINRSGKATAVELESGEIIEANKAIVAAIHPHCLGDAVDGLDAGLLERAKKTTPGAFGSMMVHAAMDGPANWYAGEAPTKTNTMNLIGTTDFEEFRRSFDELKYGELPRTFVAGVCIQTDRDASRAPPGKHTLYCFVFAPFNLKHGGAEAWDSVKEKHADWVMQNLEKFAPGFASSNILARYVESPLDMQRWTPSFQSGDIMGLGGYLYQSLGLRPTAELSQYRVPGAEGLYLSGPFMHPGGGLTGGGRAVALRVMDDLGVSYDDVIKA